MEQIRHNVLCRFFSPPWIRGAQSPFIGFSGILYPFYKFSDLCKELFLPLLPFRDSPEHDERAVPPIIFVGHRGHFHVTGRAVNGQEPDRQSRCDVPVGRSTRIKKDPPGPSVVPGYSKKTRHPASLQSTHRSAGLNASGRSSRTVVTFLTVPLKTMTRISGPNSERTCRHGPQG